ncbi:MAG: cupin domain-containing protein [Thermomicrobiales bacterium]
MRLWKGSLVALLLLTLVAAIPVAADPPANTIRYQFRADGLPVSGPMEMVKFVFDFAPGAATPLHTHPGLVVATVLEGTLTFSRGGIEKVYGVGENIIEVPNEVGLARNDTAGRTRAMVSVLVPKGAAPSTPQPGGPSPAPPAPVTLYLTRADAAIPTGAYEVVNVVSDFVPGAQTPQHTHPGQVFVTVLEGTITFRTGGTEKTYGVGESFVEQPGVVGQAVNASGAKTTLTTTYLLPKGAALLTPISAFFIRRLGDG